MSAAARHRLMHQRWPFLKKEAEGRAWMQAHREPLQYALAYIKMEALTLHFYRWSLITFSI